MSDTRTPDEIRTALVYHNKRSTRGQISALIALLPLTVAMFALLNGVKLGPGAALPVISIVSLVVLLRELSASMRSHEEAAELKRQLAVTQRRDATKS